MKSSKKNENIFLFVRVKFFHNAFINYITLLNCKNIMTSDTKLDKSKGIKYMPMTIIKNCILMDFVLTSALNFFTNFVSDA